MKTQLILFSLIAAVGVGCNLGCNVRPQSSAAANPDAKRFAVGAAPASLSLADFNGDGKLDLAVANSESKNVTILLGDGKGGLTQASGSPFPAGDHPNDIAAGDVNGDGKLDLAFANHDTHYVTVLLGDGRGGFAPAPKSPFTVNSRPHPHGIAFGDFNGDHNLDFVIDDWGNNQVTVVFGDGKGNFASPGVSFAVGQMPYQRARVADVNQDGFADVITTNTEGGDVSVLLGNGKGSFTQPPGSPFTANERPFGVAIGDLNGDGKPDLAIVNFSGHITDTSKDAITILLGSGDGTFRQATGSPFKAGRSPVSVAIGDINGDGYGDVASANMGGNNVTLLLGGKNGLRPAPGSPFAVGHHPECVALGDLNGDGKADIVVANLEDNDVMIILSK